MKNAKIVTMVFGILLMNVGEAKTVRATEMTGSLWQRIASGTSEGLIVEFRSGDELLVSFTAEGDLIETSRNGVSTVSVKRNFWVKLEKNTVKISLDGTTYQPITEVLTGSLTAGAGSQENGGIANAINLVLRATLTH